MHDLGQGTVYWLEGKIEERLTKYKKAYRLKFTENFFRIGSLKVINSWGDDPKPLPATVCSNLTSNVGWSMGTEVLPTDDNSAIEIKPGDIPISKKEEEVVQDDGDETAEDHSDDEETNGASNRVKIMPGVNENGTDTESLNNIRLASNKLEDD